ncbi:MAG TPA: Mut7-C RNAse domain-containing protein, partial [Anaerolineae bacterium]|nr:Mut7-C RNAse domain-containing protein [Anaerolineae bacterium]
MAYGIRFLADGMLGSLAKWLRILGYDTTYYPHLEDNEIARLARAEDRVLLTRDTGLLRRKGLHSLFVESELLEQQLAQVLQDLDLQDEQPFSRCPVCNTMLEDVPKHEAWGQVPPYVFQTQQAFRLCPA